MGDGFGGGPRDARVRRSGTRIGNASSDSGRRTLMLAHRGDHRTAPENTLEAFQAALRVPGVDGVELDVRRCRDGTPVVIHDPSLLRVQRRSLVVREAAVDDLASAGIPTLDAVLRAIPAIRFVDVELKEDIAADVVSVLEASRGPELAAAVITSFEPAVLEAVRRLRPAWPRWLNVDAFDDVTRRTALGLGCTGVSVEWHAMSRDACAAAAANGLVVAAWTIRTRDELAEALAWEPVAICLEGEALSALEAWVTALHPG